MLWVLKRTVSMRRFFCATSTYAKSYGEGNIYNFALIFFVYLNLCMYQCAWCIWFMHPCTQVITLSEWLSEFHQLLKPYRLHFTEREPQQNLIRKTGGAGVQGGSKLPLWRCGSTVAQWLSAWLETKGPRFRASPASLGCVLEQDTFILA